MKRSFDSNSFIWLNTKRLPKKYFGKEVYIRYLPCIIEEFNRQQIGEVYYDFKIPFHTVGGTYDFANRILIKYLYCSKRYYNTYLVTNKVWCLEYEKSSDAFYACPEIEYLLDNNSIIYTLKFGINPFNKELDVNISKFTSHIDDIEKDIQSYKKKHFIKLFLYKLIGGVDEKYYKMKLHKHLCTEYLKNFYKIKDEVKKN